MMSDPIQSTIEFIRECYGTADFIPLHEPIFIGNEKKYLIDTIDSTFVSSVGLYVDKFEERITELSGTKKATAVVNGTAALQVGLRLAGVQAGDEVITQALTFVATANAIRYNYAEPLFLDVDYDTMGLSPTAVEEFLDTHAELRDEGCYNRLTGKRIAACLPMHTFGFPVHLNKLINVCEKWRIPIVEDAAESLGSEYRRKPTGSFGLIGTYSFNGNKIVTAGGGGAIVSNDIKMAQRAKHLTTTAKKSHAFEFFHDELGYNFRMPNVNAALIYAQLENLDLFLEAKRVQAEKYAAFFPSEGITFRSELPDTKANYWLYCIELDDRSFKDKFLKRTNKSGIMTRPIWQLMYRLPMYQDCYRDAQTNAEFLEQRIVNIPSSVILS